MTIDDLPEELRKIGGEKLEAWSDDWPTHDEHPEWSDQDMMDAFTAGFCAGVEAKGKTKRVEV